MLQTQKAMSHQTGTNNKRKLTKYLLLIWLLTLGCRLSAQQSYILTDEKQSGSLLPNAAYLLDKQGKQHPDSLLWGSASKSFKPYSGYKPAPNSPGSILWLKLTINNISDHDIRTFIYWGYSSKIDVYLANVSKITQTFRLGYSREKQQHPYSSPLNEGSSVLIRANPSETIVLIGYQCNENLNTSLYQQTLEPSPQHKPMHGLMQGAFFGILLIMSIYHFLIYLNIKDRSYILYILYIAAVGLTFLRTNSFLTSLLPGDVLTNFLILAIISDNLISPAYLLFTREYVKLRDISPRWDKTALWLIRARLGMMAACFIIFQITRDPSLTFSIINISLLIEILIFSLSFRTISQRGSLVAKYFVVGTMVLFAFSVVAVLFLVLDGYNGHIGTILIEYGACAQILVFAAGFGKKLKLDEEEKLSAQERLIQQLKENELLQTKVNRELEEKVKERTREIVLQKEEIESQIDELERSNTIIKKKNTQITDSIHYAKRIQDAFLPMESELSDSFSDCFIYYQAREIVSGDFYWVKRAEDRLFIAVADATGHGVPGALMSMLGNAALNEAAGNISQASTDEILNRMRNVVKQALRQTGEDHEAKDGFDISICSFDFKKQVMEFSGANRPILIYQDTKMVELKGDRQPIGIYINELPFSSQSFPLSKGDCIYLFTDGYSSQFGGEKKETFKTKRFKELLQNIYKQPMAVQKQELDNCLKAWKGGTDQIDDITVIGLRV